MSWQIGEYADGDRVRVTIEGRAEGDLEAALTHGTFAAFSEDSVTIEKLTDPVGDVTGAEVWITGDVDEWSHHIAAGTLVKIVNDRDYTEDGTYAVKLPDDADDDDSFWVGANDLSIDPPVVTYGPGTVVQSKQSGHVYTVHEDGYFAHALNKFFNGTVYDVFTSETFVALTP